MSHTEHVIDLFNQSKIVSYEVNSILAGPSTFLERSGGILIFIVVSLSLLGASLVSYPETINFQASFAADPYPATIEAPRDGVIDRWLIEEGAEVKQGQVIAVLTSPADFEEVLEMEDALTRFQEAGPDFEFADWQDLGILQSHFADFRSAWSEFNLETSRMEDDTARKATDAIAGELQKEFETLVQAIDVQTRKLSLQEEELTIRQQLFRQGAGSKLAVNQIQQLILDQQNTITSLQRQQGQVRQRQIELQHEKAIRLESDRVRYLGVKRRMLELLSHLRSQISLWRYSNCLIAPIDGEASVYGPRAAQRTVLSGEHLLTLYAPSTAYRILGELKPENAGLVRVGQGALVSVDAYPSSAFGKLKGRVSHVSEVTSKGSVFVVISIPEDLVTTQGKQLHYRNAMTASVAVLTKPATLLDRMIREAFDDFG